MTTTTSIKIEKFVLERLREHYPDMTANEMFETIVTEENMNSREIYPDVLVSDVAKFISKMKEKYPKINIREIIAKCDKTLI